MIETLLTWICFLFALPVGLALLIKPGLLAKKSGDSEELKKRELPIRLVGAVFLLLALIVML